MNEQFSQDELKLMTDLITDYISKIECYEYLIGNNYNCIQCGNIEDCYMIANSRCNSEFAENINYGGYDSEEEFFWSNYLIKVVIYL